MYKNISFFIATMAGAGYAKKAPGTVGSFVTLPFAFVIAYYFGFWGIVAASLIISLVGVAAIKEVLKYTKHDPSCVVIDEMAGQILSFALVADRLVGNMTMQAFIIYALGFGLFRLFDITKPQPVGWADRKLENAWGVMLDDIFAGVYATLILYFITIYLWF